MSSSGHRSHPDPGAALLALPRRVRTGQATFTIDLPGSATQDFVADPDSDRLGFNADVPAGSTIQSVSVQDSCGNSTN